MTIEARHWFFQDNEESLQQLAYGALARGLTSDQFMVIAVDIYDPTWRAFLECLIPKQDCQKFRNPGGAAVARAVVKSEIVENISAKMPDIEPALKCDVPPCLARAVVMASGGASVYFIKPSFFKTKSIHTKNS